MSGLAPRAAELAAAVSERELARLLGLPRERPLEGELGARADAARGWYARHGDPFAATRRLAVVDAGASQVQLEDGTVLRSAALANGLRRTEGHALVALAVSAGRAVAAEASRLWAAERPDEAFFLDRFAAAATEALVLWASGEECRSASAAGETLLPALSPGCGDFDIADQQRLFALLGGAPQHERAVLGPIELLPTGALAPPHSLLAAVGVTRRALARTTPDDLCRSCALERCAYRRAAYRKGSGREFGCSPAASAAAGVRAS